MAVTDEIKLRLFNGALRRLGDRNLASLSDNREPRRVLEDVWGGSDEVVKWALELGDWNFAIRAALVDYNPSISPVFGFDYAFDKPDDICRLTGIAADEAMQHPLENSQYLDEAGYWFSSYEILYVRYVSCDTDYGLNSGIWPELFKELLELKLAWEACERLTNSKGLGDRIDRELRRALRDAKSYDAMQEGVKRLPAGRWVRSRAGYGSRA